MHVLQSNSPSNQSKHEHKTWPTRSVRRKEDIKCEGKFDPELFKNVQGSIIDMSWYYPRWYPRLWEMNSTDNEDWWCRFSRAKVIQGSGRKNRRKVVSNLSSSRGRIMMRHHHHQSVEDRTWNVSSQSKQGALWSMYSHTILKNSCKY